jgi:hypothetical protein
MYVVKLDSAGTLQWSKTIGGSNDDWAWSIIQTTDGGVAVGGWTQSFGLGGDLYIVKLDAHGGLEWARTVGTTFFDLGVSLIQTADGGFAVAGSTGGSNIDMYIVKLDTAGNIQWSKEIGGSDNEEPSSIIQTVDGGYAVVGYTFSFGSGIEDTYVVKLDAAGNTCGNALSISSSSGTGGILGTPASIIDSPNTIVTAPTPDTSSGGTLTAVCVTEVQPGSNKIPDSYKLFQNYPNPFNPVTTIEYSIPKRSLVRLEIFDVLSQQITTLVDEEQPSGAYKIQWQAKDFPSGVYFYRLHAGSFTETRRLVLLR